MLSVWSLRRVLLAGSASDMMRAMTALLCSVGAKPLHASTPFSAESLSRALQQRCCCLIVPDLPVLHACDPEARLHALNTLLFEGREAGVPLVMLLSRMNTAADNEIIPLFSHAQGFGQGACGDPISVQCIRYDGGDIQRICRDALALGARFLAGETGCTGIFTLGKR